MGWKACTSTITQSLSPLSLWRGLGRGCFLFLVLCSCEHKDLCYHHPHQVTIRVEFDWRNAPEANPEGMCVFFYPEEGGEPARFDFPGTTGGEITLAGGRYKVLTYNNDNEAVQFTGQLAYGTHMGFTREGSLFEPIYGSGYYTKSVPQARGTEDERVVICPDMIWGCTAPEVEITESGLFYTCVPEEEKDELVPVESREQVITLYPCEQLCHYSYEIRNAENLGYTTQMCACLTGMAGTLTLAPGTLGSESVTLPFAATANHAEATITGQFLTFGHCETNPDPHNLVLYVWMNDGSKYYYTFDVTTQVHTAPDKRHVHLIVDGLKFPETFDDNAAGYQPTIDDWVEEQVEIPM
ncbi:MAG: DUF5119 domain-containing protein [Bacteroides sp.]|nr:DUF5119 domain-containing protein [Bacteroides sp.]